MDGHHSDDNDNDDDDDDNDDDDDDYFSRHMRQDLYGHLNISSIPVVQTRTDNIFNGLGSKESWSRRDQESYFSEFLIQEELFVYCNFWMRPFLQELLRTQDRLYIWIACKMIFYKVSFSLSFSLSLSLMSE